MQHFSSRKGLIAVTCLTLALSALCAMPAGMAAPAETKAGSAAVGRVDINSASAEELTRIPGIGKVMAERIVQFREQHGPFKRVEDLLKIKGIGEKSFLRIKPYVTTGKSK